MRYFLEICYKGTNYSGWQIQDNAHTVQAELNNALTILLKTPTATVGAGRTDAGVHALGMVAHFDSHSVNLSEFEYKLNALLPRDVAIRQIRPVKSEAHARFDALSRSYEYRIYSRKEPFVIKDAFFFNQSLDIDSIEKALKIIRQQNDFEAFSKAHSEVNHHNCEIMDARWNQISFGHRFYIRADRFLRGMVRTMVGTLLDVGTGKLSPNEVLQILQSKNRSNASRSVSADGLYFVSADYPEDVYL